ncbi:LcrR family type III secretion system chaperone [Pseudomonas sp. MWU13-3659]|uniref:LcrR family type III secretion system chaperone n=1 Tax=Pseudomonas sp. MWU13-3659 TaxID=2986964 RepID=UPI002076135B|nr:LcrR family type III secretion system chaperone [Pseudomonas sp. MWU13-3659]
MSDERLCAWFQAQGYRLRPQYWRNTRIRTGWQFSCQACELTWRCEGERVWIVMFRRAQARRGLGNAFAALYLLAEAVSQALGPRHCLYGNVQTLADSPLQAERLKLFYLRWGEAREPQPGWFEIPAAAVRPMRSVRSDKLTTINDRRGNR